MSNALFPTVSELDYPALRRLMPHDTFPTYPMWKRNVYACVVDHLSGGYGAQAMVIEIDPVAARRYFEAKGIEHPGRTDLANYAWTLDRPFVATDPEELLRGDEPQFGAR